MNLKCKNNVLYVICGLLLILVFSGGLLFFEQLKDNDIKLDEVKLRNSNNDSGMFAIMLEQDDGTYQESTSNTWPDGYTYNEEKSGCADSEGNALDDVLTYDSVNKKALVKSNTTTYCYLYFNLPIPDIKVIVSTDGVSGVVPTTLGYTKEITCDNASPSWNYKYNRLEFSQISAENYKCNLTYTEDTNTYPSLISEVEANATTNANGYRYSGKNPNNYIWFNNELWRIIGSIPTKQSDGTISNLVKIIRNETIGALEYNRSGDITWGSNTLYTHLNTHYYATSKANLNGQSSNGCSRANCNYTDIGILSTSYYGSMVEKVYWDTGTSSKSVSANTAYTNEIKTRRVLGFIGLMTASDFGYAADSSYHSTSLSSYNTLAITSTNWLYNNNYEWTIICDSSNTDYVLYVGYDGRITSYYDNQYYAVRPVLYLDSSVYIINGDGSINDPYQIAMR